MHILFFKYIKHKKYLKIFLMSITDLQRGAYGWHCGETNDIAEVNGNWIVRFRFYTVSQSQTFRHWPTIECLYKV